MVMKYDVPSLGTPAASDPGAKGWAESIRWIVFVILVVIAAALLVGGAILGR